jgi:hypothetical protein
MYIRCTRMFYFVNFIGIERKIPLHVVNSTALRGFYTVESSVLPHPPFFFVALFRGGEGDWTNFLSPLPLKCEGAGWQRGTKEPYSAKTWEKILNCFVRQQKRECKKQDLATGIL